MKDLHIDQKIIDYIKDDSDVIILKTFEPNWLYEYYDTITYPLYKWITKTKIVLGKHCCTLKLQSVKDNNPCISIADVFGDIRIPPDLKYIYFNRFNSLNKYSKYSIVIPNIDSLLKTDNNCISLSYFISRDYSIKLTFPLVLFLQMGHLKGFQKILELSQKLDEANRSTARNIFSQMNSLWEFRYLLSTLDIALWLQLKMSETDDITYKNNLNTLISNIEYLNNIFSDYEYVGSNVYGFNGRIMKHLITIINALKLSIKKIENQEVIKK